MLLHMPHAELIKSGFVCPTSSAATARAELRRNMDAIVEELHETMFGGPHTLVVEWYEKTKVFLPPEPLRSQHAGFATAWKQVQDKGEVERPVLRKVATHIESNWHTNIVLFARYYDDPRCRYGEAQRGYPNMKLNLFDTVDEIHPFNNRDDKQSSVDMDTLALDVCSTSFEEVAAYAYHAIPFPLTPGALPADFSRDPDDIALWEVPVQPSGHFMMARGFHGSPYEPRTQLLFYRSDKLSAAELIRDMGSIFEGTSSPAPGLLFVLTAPEDVMHHEKIQFRLRRRRVERMRKEKWSMVAYRNDTGVQGTNSAAISSWIAKS
ncbi:hypothetical protein C8T65DRAFT_835299 [Cerioporus squamosus]|nr:hypothetical protein C8T65DRAFT_835299 [Cerioporus squamosus]